MSKNAIHFISQFIDEKNTWTVHLARNDKAKKSLYRGVMARNRKGIERRNAEKGQKIWPIE